MSVPGHPPGGIRQAEFVAVAQAEDIPPGSARQVEVGGRPIALVNADGMFLAVDGDCPHHGGPLGEGQVWPGCVLACPWHGAVFDARTGEVLRGPARKPVRTYQVKVADGAVLVAVP